MVRMYCYLLADVMRKYRVAKSSVKFSVYGTITTTRYMATRAHNLLRIIDELDWFSYLSRQDVSTYASIISRREAGVAGCPCIPAFSTHEEEVGEARGLSILSFQHPPLLSTPSQPLSQHRCLCSLPIACLEPRQNPCHLLITYEAEGKSTRGLY